MPTSSLTGLTSTLSVTEGDPAVLVAPNVTFTSDGDFRTGAYLVIQGASASETFSARNQGVGAGQIGVSGSDVTYGGVIIGALVTTGGVVRVNFNDAVSTAAIEALVENLTYVNSSANPAAHHEVALNIVETNPGTRVAALISTAAPTGLRLWGMVDEPPLPGADGSNTSAASVCINRLMSRPSLPRLPAIKPSTLANSTRRSR